MAKAKLVSDSDGRFYGVRFNCPGCACAHVEEWRGHELLGANVLPVHWLPPGRVESPQVATMPHWTFNGDLDRPTFTPSVLTEQPMPGGKMHRCHSYVTDGRIQFLGDCTHALAGQTVDLPDVQAAE